MTANTKITEELIRFELEAHDRYEQSMCPPRKCSCDRCKRNRRFLEGLQAGRAEMADGKEVFEITHRVNENALTVVELESRLSHLSAVNEKLAYCLRASNFLLKDADQLKMNRTILKLADEMGEGK